MPSPGTLAPRVADADSEGRRPHPTHHHGSVAQRTRLRLVAHEPDEAIEEIDEVERRLEEALERSPLPAAPDRTTVDRFLVDAYRRAWGW